MNPYNIKSGWWVSVDNSFVCCYNSKEEAINHVKYQKEKMHSKANWRIQHIKIKFEESLKFPYEDKELPNTGEPLEDVNSTI